MVAHLCLVIPAANCMRTISRVLWVLTCGLSRSGLPAMRKHCSMFLRMMSLKNNRPGLKIDDVSANVYCRSMVASRIAIALRGPLRKLYSVGARTESQSHGIDKHFMR